MEDNEDCEETVVEFHQMGIDDRILKAIAKLNWKQPTPIQEKVIPLALEGKDILARARTGTGKTACFLIPIIQKLLELKKTAKEQKVRAVIMAPSRELCNQAYAHLKLLASYCAKELTYLDISGQVAIESQKPLLMDMPDIVVGTPSRLLAHLRAGNVTLKASLEMLVIDEADLVFSFGYEADMKALLSFLPSIYQAFLMSATLNDDVQSMKKMILHNAAIVKLDEAYLAQSSQLTHYLIKCEDEDKFVLIYALLKLMLIRGKTLVFVSTVDRCYKLKLFLHHVGIEACVVNPELPVNSRSHIISQFNSGLYDIIIGSDSVNINAPLRKANTVGRGNPFRRSRKLTEYSIARGIDFRNVSNVINFDFPQSAEAYVHRVGRTARGDSEGAALSFISMEEMDRFEEIKKQLAGTDADDAANLFRPFNFKMDELDGFRYRARDAYRAASKAAVRKARVCEIRVEMLTSKHLKTYFEENPRDKAILKHDAMKGQLSLDSHLRHVPDYIVPATLKSVALNKKKTEETEAYDSEAAVPFFRKERERMAISNAKKRNSDVLERLDVHRSRARGMKKKKRW